MTKTITHPTVHHGDEWFSESARPILTSWPAIKAKALVLAKYCEEVAKTATPKKKEAKPEDKLTDKGRRALALIDAHFKGSDHREFLLKTMALVLDDPAIESYLEEKAVDEITGPWVNLLPILDDRGRSPACLVVVPTTNPNSHSYETGEPVLCTGHENYAIKTHLVSKLGAGYSTSHLTGNHLPYGTNGHAIRPATVAETKKFLAELGKAIKAQKHVKPTSVPV